LKYFWAQAVGFSLNKQALSKPPKLKKEGVKLVFFALKQRVLFD
jgi:hypothetical protein